MTNIKSPEIFGDELEKIFGERLKKRSSEIFRDELDKFW